MMMQRSRLLTLALLGGLIAGALTHAAAQAPSPAAAPGAGHGFLIDKHVAAGLNCAACHTESPPSKPADQAACIKCHGTNAQVASKTASDQPNPHASHLGEIACTSCHHVHQASVLYCAQCHNFDLKTP
jgi:Zn finger protein HypA/HybF involved in hydrogenase expression